MRIVIEPPHSYTAKHIADSAVFRRWQRSVGGDAWQGTITVTDINIWAGEIHGLVVRLQREGAPWPTYAVLRSATVDVQVQISDGRSEPYLLFVAQWRDTVGQVVISNPAGGVNWGESPAVAARREAAEETGLPPELVAQGTLTQLGHRPVIANPGSTNELTYLFTLELIVSSEQLHQYLSSVAKRTTGVAAEGEQLRVYPTLRGQARDFIYGNEQDAKTLLSLALSGV